MIVIMNASNIFFVVTNDKSDNYVYLVHIETPLQYKDDKMF